MTQTDLEAGSTSTVLGLCLLIVRAGCRDSLVWWDDDSLTEAGLFSLKRLFPQTYRIAAVRLGLAAARSRHDGMLNASGITGAQHLLDLLEPAGPIDFLAQLDRVPFDFWSPIPDRNSFQQRLEAVAGPLPSVPSGVAAALQGLVDLSEVLPKHEATVGVAKMMAASYLLGDRGRLVLPYTRRHL